VVGECQIAPVLQGAIGPGAMDHVGVVRRELPGSQAERYFWVFFELWRLDQA
jgi:hypothetical protein